MEKLYKVMHQLVDIHKEMPTQHHDSGLSGPCRHVLNYTVEEICIFAT